MCIDIYTHINTYNVYVCTYWYVHVSNNNWLTADEFFSVLSRRAFHCPSGKRGAWWPLFGLRAASLDQAAPTEQTNHDAKLELFCWVENKGGILIASHRALDIP